MTDEKTIGSEFIFSPSRQHTDQELDILQAAAAPVRYLFKLYQTALQEREIREITVRPAQGRVQLNEGVVVREPEATNMLTFQDLPVSLQLYVFSYLNAETLCRVGATSQYWRILSEDTVLWSNLLRNDIKKWTSINHLSCPLTYTEANTELTPKQIYMRCCPECRAQQKPRESFKSIVFYNLQNLQNLFSHRPPRVVMFGPGLESDTSQLVRALLWNNMSPFQVTGMFPGEFEGIGSGVCLKFNNAEMNLITLYASTRKEREERAKDGRDRNSKLLAQPDLNEEEEEESNHEMEVTHPVRQLCKTVDAFVYVVEASAHKRNAVKLGDKELKAMMNENWTAPKVPLLVLGCVPMATTPSLSCSDVIELLELRKLNRPWQVNAACVENFEGITAGMKWLLAQSKSS